MIIKCVKYKNTVRTIKTIQNHNQTDWWKENGKKLKTSEIMEIILHTNEHYSMYWRENSNKKYEHSKSYNALPVIYIYRYIHIEYKYITKVIRKLLNAGSIITNNKHGRYSITTCSVILLIGKSEGVPTIKFMKATTGRDYMICNGKKTN